MSLSRSLLTAVFLSLLLVGCKQKSHTTNKSSAESGNSSYAFSNASGETLPTDEAIDSADAAAMVDEGYPVRTPNYSGAWDPPPEIQKPLRGEARARQLKYMHMANRYARAGGQNPFFIQAIITIESKYRPCVKSPAGAVGLMQFMPGTANGLRRVTGITAATRCNPDLNVRSGVAYFNQMGWAKGNLQAMAAGYNSGPARAKALLYRNTKSKYWRSAQPSTSNGVPGPHYWGGETYNYARRMAGYYELYKANPHLVGLADSNSGIEGSGCDARGEC